MPRLDIKQISGGKNHTVAPAFSSLIHVVLQGSFCANGVSGTIPSAQRDSENTHLMESLSHIDFSRRYSYHARYLTSPFPLSLPLFSSLLLRGPRPVSAPSVLSFSVLNSTRLGKNFLSCNHSIHYIYKVYKIHCSC